MLWIIFFISVLLLTVSVLARVYALVNGEYLQHSLFELVQDIFDIMIAVLGCSAIYFAASVQSIGSQQFWQGFFVVNIVMVLLCYFSPKFKTLKAEFGIAKTVKVIALNLILSMPFFYGLYYYAFNHEW